MEKLLNRVEKENNASTGAPTMFMTEDGFPMTFHLIITDSRLNKQVTDLVYEMGGIIDEDFQHLNPKTILLVESSVYDSVRKFVRVPFKPEFVLDNAKSSKLLDLRDYLYDDCVKDLSQAFIDVIYYNIREFKPINIYPDDLSETTRIARKDAPFTSGFLSIPSTSGSSDSHQKTTKADLSVILKKLASNPQRKTYNFNRKVTKKGKENTKKELKSIGTNTDESLEKVSPTKKAKKRTSSQVEGNLHITHLSEVNPMPETPQKKMKRSNKNLSTTDVQKFQREDTKKVQHKSTKDDSVKPLMSEPKLKSSKSGGSNPSSITVRRKSSRNVVDSSSSDSDVKSSSVRVKPSSLFSSTPTSHSKMRRESPKKSPISPLLKEIGQASVRKNLKKFKDSPEKSRIIKNLKRKSRSSDSSDSDSCVKRLLKDAQRKQPKVTLSRVAISTLNSSSRSSSKSPKTQTIKTSYIPKAKGKPETKTAVLKRKDKTLRKSTREIKPTEKSLKMKMAEKRVKKSTISDLKKARKTNVKLNQTKKSVKTSPKVLKINNRKK